MGNNSGLKVLILARETLKKRIKTILVGEVEFLEIVQYPFGPCNYQFDIAIVDVTVENAEATCHKITDILNIPLILVVKETSVDWERLERLNANGFIRDTMSRLELVARLNAVKRRFLKSAVGSKPLRLKITGFSERYFVPVVKTGLDAIIRKKFTVC